MSNPGYPSWEAPQAPEPSQYGQPAPTQYGSAQPGPTQYGGGGQYGSPQFGSAPYPSQPPGGQTPEKKGFLGNLLAMGMAKVGGLIGGVVLLAIVATIGYFMSRNDAENASVGDCLPASAMEDSTADASTIETTDCAGADAAYRVVGTYQQTEVEFQLDQEWCSAYPTTESGLWIGELGRTGTVLCLEPVTH
ncbi:MAG TPA: hypothetical protein VFY84_18605 [Jiangellales bacterium]|nr:hypothetical protein [Jiangellales bacterium]